MLDTTSRSPASERGDQATLRLAVEWCWPPDLTSLSRLRTPSTIIGRDPTCGIHRNDNETSRRHAELVVRGRQASVRDLGSTNGITVNGHRVSSCQLGPGDVVRVGRSIGVVQLREDNDSGPSFSELGPGLHGGARLRHAIEPVRRVAIRDLPVVIEGETGVGKERVATALHAWSGRTGPYLAVNCAAIPEALAEAELFGHRRGAFTGADMARTGHFRSAHQGTLLLDEVHELPAAVQAKLLRVVELREVTPLGDSRGIPVDVRIVVTCPGTLSDHVAAGAFRADLFGRLAGVAVRVPPLRERREDVPGLFMHFADGELDVEAMSVGFVEQLVNYDYPLNVRELRQLAVRVAALHAGEYLTAQHFEQAVQAKRSTRPPPTPAIEVTPELVEQTLNANEGNLAKTAKHLGISRQRAYRMLGELRTGERAEPRR